MSTVRVTLTWDAGALRKLSHKWLMGSAPSKKQMAKFRSELAEALLDAGILWTDVEHL